MTEQWNPWGPIDENPKMNPEDLERDLQLSKDFFSTFSTESGERILTYWESYTTDMPTWVPNLSDGQGHWREGQNSIIREIKYRINKAKNTEE